MTLPRCYWALFVLSLAIYLTMVLWTLPAISSAACGLRPFDLRPTGYSPEDARRFLTCLSDDGRRLYEGPQRWLDLIYPAVLALVLVGAVHALISSPALRTILILAIIGGTAADYVENMLVGRMLADMADVTDELVRAASRATIVKSVLTGLAILAVCVGLVRLLMMRRSRK